MSLRKTIMVVLPKSAEKYWTNKGRIEVARSTIEYYGMAKQAEGEPAETLLIDLMSDLRHYCKKNNLSFDDAVRISEDHFTAETEKLDAAIRRAKQ